MSKSIRNLSIFGLLIMLTLAVPSVKAEPIENWHILYRSAGAEFQTTSGCISTHVQISAVDYYKESPPLPQQPASRIYVNMSSYNNCTGELLISTWEDLPLPDGALKVSGQQAELNATVPVLNKITKTVSDVNINLKWIATGEPHIEVREVTRDEGETFKRLTIRMLTRVPAVADGTVVFDGENRIADPSLRANIDKSKVRWVIKGQLPEEYPE